MRRSGQFPKILHKKGRDAHGFAVGFLVCSIGCPEPPYKTEVHGFFVSNALKPNINNKINLEEHVI